MQRPSRQIQPCAAGAPQLRAPRLIGPEPVVFSYENTAHRQNPMSGVRILLKFYTTYIHLYAMFFKGTTHYGRN
jgi:hypothetical protein